MVNDTIRNNQGKKIVFLFFISYVSLAGILGKELEQIRPYSRQQAFFIIS